MTLKKDYLNSQDEKGQSPLHYAVLHHNLIAAKALIKTKGVNIEKRLTIKDNTVIQTTKQKILK